MSERDVESSASGIERTVTFSDGVFAIAITLLVLPLTEAHLREDRLAQDLLNLLPQALTATLSFAVIGRYWLAHHREFRRISGIDTPLLVINLFFLFWVVFLPFPTSLLGQFGDTVAATLIYGVNLMAASLSSTLLWWYAVTHGLTTGADRATRRRNLVRGLAAAAALVPSIPLAFVSTDWAKVSWLLLVPAGLLSTRVDQGSQPTRPASSP